MELWCPAAISDAARARVRSWPSRSFRLVGCSGMARVDFFVEDGDEVLVNELNTIPGFTPTSVYAKLLDASGLPYPPARPAAPARARSLRTPSAAYRH